MKEMYRDQFGEFVSGYWGLKGYTLLPKKKLAQLQRCSVAA